MPIASAAYTAQGPRERQEDAFYFDSSIYVIADGMGGHAHGDIASKTAVQAFTRADGTLSDRMKVAETVLMRARRDYRADMDTTLTACQVQLIGGNPVLEVVNAGDSRCYVLYPGRTLSQITQDHVLREDLWHSRHIPISAYTEAIAQEQYRNLTGSVAQGRWDTHRRHIPRGALVLLTTDGVHGVLSSEDILTCLRERLDLDARARLLVEQAHARGSTDNATAILIGVS